MTKNYCVWSASKNRDYLKEHVEPGRFHREESAGKRGKGKPSPPRKIGRGI
jgi:hypothetical protein